VGRRRTVRVSQHLVTNAQSIFPPGGSVIGNPSYEAFEAGPLAAAKQFFGRAFDEAPEAAAGIRVWITIDLPLFPPMAFYAALVGGNDEVENFEGALGVRKPSTKSVTRFWAHARRLLVEE
jgi:hypothetical protein